MCHLFFYSFLSCVIKFPSGALGWVSKNRKTNLNCQLFPCFMDAVLNFYSALMFYTVCNPASFSTSLTSSSVYIAISSIVSFPALNILSAVSLCFWLMPWFNVALSYHFFTPDSRRSQHSFILPGYPPHGELSCCHCDWKPSRRHNPLTGNIQVLYAL